MAKLIQFSFPSRLSSFLSLLLLTESRCGGSEPGGICWSTLQKDVVAACCGMHRQTKVAYPWRARSVSSPWVGTMQLNPIFEMIALNVPRDLRRADALLSFPLNSRCLLVSMKRDYPVHIHCTRKSVARRTPAAPKRGCSKVCAAGCTRRDLEIPSPSSCNFNIFGTLNWEQWYVTVIWRRVITISWKVRFQKFSCRRTLQDTRNPTSSEPFYY